MKHWFFIFLFFLPILLVILPAIILIRAEIVPLDGNTVGGTILCLLLLTFAYLSEPAKRVRRKIFPKESEEGGKE